MKMIAFAATFSVLMIGSLSAPANAQDMAACQAKAVSKDGKPLSGAAKTSSIKKCMKDSCEAQAIDKNGKKLAGAAKTSFLKKCEGG